MTTMLKPLRALIAAYRAANAGLPREVWLLAGALLVNLAGTVALSVSLSPSLLQLSHDCFAPKGDAQGGKGEHDKGPIPTRSPEF